MITMKIRQTHARLFKNCERRYKLAVIDKFVTLRKAPALSIGTACHAGRASYLRYRDAGRAILETISVIDREIAQFPSLGENAADVAAMKTLCSEIIAGYAVYFESRFPNDNAIKILAIEVPVEVKIAEYEDLELYLVGTLDADAVYAERYRVNFEFKTTKSSLAYYFQTEFMSEQHTAYGLAQWLITGEVPYGTLLDACKKPTKTQGPEFDHQPIPKTKEDFLTLKRDYVELLKRIRYAMDNDYFPPNFDSCFTRRGTCEYEPICRSRFDPHVIRNHYAIVDDNAQVVADIEKESEG